MREVSIAKIFIIKLEFEELSFKQGNKRVLLKTGNNKFQFF